MEREINLTEDEMVEIEALVLRELAAIRSDPDRECSPKVRRHAEERAAHLRHIIDKLGSALGSQAPARLYGSAGGRPTSWPFLGHG